MKQFKNAFTLVELIAVIVLLGILSVIMIPTISNIIKENKESLYRSQLEEIRSAAEKWAYKNIDLLPSEEDDSKTIYLIDLKKAGFLSLDIRDPRNSELLPNDMEITITYKENDYLFVVDENSGSDINNDFNEKAPILILNGKAIEYIEYGSIYEEKGALSKDINGNSLDIDIIYQESGTEIPSINTSAFKTYTVIYMSSSNIDDNNYTSKITRTVIVRDTTPPNLTIPGNVEITVSEALTFNPLTGSSAIDNADGNVTISVSGFDKTVGEKIIKYKACDSRNNCVEKKRIVKITD